MPNCISNPHHLFIDRLTRTGSEKIIRRYRMAMAINKVGYIFPINVFVNYYWKITNDFCFSGLVVKLKTNSNYILTN